MVVALELYVLFYYFAGAGGVGRGGGGGVLTVICGGGIVEFTLKKEEASIIFGWLVLFGVGVEILVLLGVGTGFELLVLLGVEVFWGVDGVGSTLKNDEESWTIGWVTLFYGFLG